MGVLFAQTHVASNLCFTFSPAIISPPANSKVVDDSTQFFLARSVFNMASEIDPILVRGLHLLHSKHPKALEQLCALRDEVLGKKPEFIPEVGSLGESKSLIYY